MLRSEDLDVQIHATTVIANLAADGTNQVKIVEEGGAHLLTNIALKQMILKLLGW